MNELSQSRDASHQQGLVQVNALAFSAPAA
jgi:hypothetical protein